MAEKFNRSCDWWSDTPHDWRNDEREESILDPKGNRSLSNTNDFSEEDEVTATLQRTRKIIRGGRNLETVRTVKQEFHHELNGNFNLSNKRSQTKDYFRFGS